MKRPFVRYKWRRSRTARRHKGCSAKCSPSLKRRILPCATGQQENIIGYGLVRFGPFKTQEYAQQIAASLKRGGHDVFLDEVPESTLAKDETP